MENSQPNPSCWAEQGNRKSTQEPCPAPSAIPWLRNVWVHGQTSLVQALDGLWIGMWLFPLSSHSSPALVNVLLLISPQSCLLSRMDPGTFSAN